MSFPAQLHSSRHSTGAGQASCKEVGGRGHRSGPLHGLCAEGVRSGGPSPWVSLSSLEWGPGALSLGSTEAGSPWHLLGPLADVVQAEGGHMVLSAHKQASSFLIHQQSVVTAGPVQPEAPETVPALELCRVGTPLKIGQRCWKLPPDPVCLSHMSWLYTCPGPHTCEFTRV